MKDGTIHGNTKGESMINLKFDVIIAKNMVIMLMNVNMLLTIWNDEITMLKRKIKNLLYCSHIKRKVRRKYMVS